MTAYRLLRLVQMGLRRLFGRPEVVTQAARVLPKIVVKKKAIVLPRGYFMRQVIRALRSGSSSHVRAATMGLWNRGGRIRRGRNPAGGLAGALVLSRMHSRSSAVFDQIRDIFGEEHLRWREKRVVDYPKSFSAYEVGSHIDVGGNAAVVEARVAGGSRPRIPDSQQPLHLSDRRVLYPLALKIMFNYNSGSTLEGIMRSMGEELMPVRDGGIGTRDIRGLRVSNFHPNLVEMHTAFVDSFPLLPSAEELYPDALPPDLFADGLGSSRTLFLVMKRYTMTLYEYVRQVGYSPRTGQILFGQLLEALCYLREQRISHRDIKSNNILLDFDSPEDVPVLVLSDFGCCIRTPSSSMRVPFQADRGGNLALMAPEIRAAPASPWTTLDYSKADLWSAGTIALELFNRLNPFYRLLDSASYREEELPSLPPAVPSPLRTLTTRILRRNPKQRPSVNCAGNVVALSLFRPQTVVELFGRLERKTAEIWLRLGDCLSLYAAETLLAGLEEGGEGLSRAELLLRSTFLARVTRDEVYDALPYFFEAEP